MTVARKAATLLLLAALTLAAAVGVGVMERRFEAADLRHATEIVRGYDAGSGRTIEEVVRLNNPGARVTWDSRIRQGCFGYVRVRCRATSTTRKRTVEYRWDVDMGRIGIHPANGPARRILVQLEEEGRRSES